jgi:hypothetical protein
VLSRPPGEKWLDSRVGSVHVPESPDVEGDAADYVLARFRAGLRRLSELSSCLLERLRAEQLEQRRRLVDLRAPIARSSRSAQSRPRDSSRASLSELSRGLDMGPSCPIDNVAASPDLLDAAPGSPCPP